MIKWMWRQFFPAGIEQLAAEQLALTETMLLEAEGQLENAQGDVTVLTARRDRLKRRLMNDEQKQGLAQRENAVSSSSPYDLSLPGKDQLRVMAAGLREKLS